MANEDFYIALGTRSNGRPNTVRETLMTEPFSELWAAWLQNKRSLNSILLIRLIYLYVSKKQRPTVTYFKSRIPFKSDWPG